MNVIKNRRMRKGKIVLHGVRLQEPEKATGTIVTSVKSSWAFNA